MRKIFTTLTVAIVCLAFGMQAYAAETVYLKNTKNWAQPYVWAWNDSENCTQSGKWPGDKMTPNDATGLWEWTAPEGKVPTLIIFSNSGSSQTQDLSFVNGATYDCDGNRIIEEEIEYTVYFNNNNGWNPLYIYAFASVNNEKKEMYGTWPGTELKAENQEKWGVYKVTFQITDGVVPQIIFNGNADDKKTGNLVPENGTLYNANGKVEDNYTAPEAYTVTYTDDAGWEKVYVYYWGMVSNTWPGAEMTLVQPSASSMARAESESKTYTAVIPKGTKGLIFSDGHGAQTKDFTNENGFPNNASFTFNSETTGVEDILVEDGAREYYNLNGVKIAEENLTPGCYIVRCGNKVQKVFVR